MYDIAINEAINKFALIKKNKGSVSNGIKPLLIDIIICHMSRN